LATGEKTSEKDKNKLDNETAIKKPRGIVKKRVIKKPLKNLTSRFFALKKGFRVINYPHVMINPFPGYQNYLLPTT
jgi:hypothetical protein